LTNSLAQEIVACLLEQSEKSEKSEKSEQAKQPEPSNLRSLTTRSFRDRYAVLGPDRQNQVRRAYHAWRKDPFHPSFHFEQKNVPGNVWSVSIGGFRVLARRDGNELAWFWVGDHGPYEDMLRRIIKAG